MTTKQKISRGISYGLVPAIFSFIGCVINSSFGSASEYDYSWLFTALVFVLLCISVGITASFGVKFSTVTSISVGIFFLSVMLLTFDCVFIATTLFGCAILYFFLSLLFKVFYK